MYLGTEDVDVNRVERDGGGVFDDIEAVAGVSIVSKHVITDAYSMTTLPSYSNVSKFGSSVRS